MQEVPPAEPVEEGDEGERNKWGSLLEVVVQPPLSRSSWRSWSTSPLLLRGAQSLRLLPRERRRVLRRLLLLEEKQQPRRCKRRRPPKLGWWILPVSLERRP
jgi:hypothetical protein